MSRHCFSGPTRKAEELSERRLPRVYLNAKGAGLPSRSDGSELSAESERRPPKQKQIAKPSSRCPLVRLGQHAKTRPRPVGGSCFFSTRPRPLPTLVAVAAPASRIWRRPTLRPSAKPPRLPAAGRRRRPPEPSPFSRSFFMRLCVSELRARRRRAATPRRRVADAPAGWSSPPPESDSPSSAALLAEDDGPPRRPPPRRALKSPAATGYRGPECAR